MSTKPLPPTLREKNRYLVLGIISKKKFNKQEVQKALWSSAFNFLGELGLAKTSLWFIDWDEKKQKGIIKVNQKSVEKIRASIALIKKIKREKILPYVLGVSGTIKKARKKWM